MTTEDYIAFSRILDNLAGYYIRPVPALTDEANQSDKGDYYSSLEDAENTY